MLTQEEKRAILEKANYWQGREETWGHFDDL